MKFYDYYLSSNDYQDLNEEQLQNELYSICSNMDSTFETTEQTIAYIDYKFSHNGVGVYYCYGTSDYYFTDETEEI